jgi:2-dehydropantoate 2-reductase
MVVDQTGAALLIAQPFENAVARPMRRAIFLRFGQTTRCRYMRARIAEIDMKIAAMAAGAVGGYFGGRLAAAGHDVHFVARGAHRDAIAASGLRIESVHGDLHLPKVNVTDDPAKIGPVDIVLFAVKLWDTETATQQAKPMIGANTRVITFQNGVDSVERLGAVIGADKAVCGIAYIATVIAAPGVIKHTSSFATMRFGQPGAIADRRADPALQALANAGKAAKLDIDLSPDIEVERWQKFIFLTAMAGATATLRSPIGPIVADPQLRQFFRQLMEEAYRVGKAQGVAIPDNYIEERMAFVLNKVEPGMKASMAHDLERGNRLELDWLNGKVAELGRALNIATPASDIVCTTLKLHRMGVGK